MLDGASLSAIILSIIALFGTAWGQVKYCESGCIKCDKETAPVVNEKKREIVVPPSKKD